MRPPSGSPQEIAEALSSGSYDAFISTYVFDILSEADIASALQLAHRYECRHHVSRDWSQPPQQLPFSNCRSDLTAVMSLSAHMPFSTVRKASIASALQLAFRYRSTTAGASMPAHEN